MDVWQETQLQSTLSAESEDEIYASLIRAAKTLGFECAAYGLRVPLPVSSPRVSMVNNYPAAWQRQYEEKNYLACDPTVAHALTSCNALLWSESLFSTCRPFWEEARKFGLQVGWAQPCHGSQGVVGLLTLSRSHDDLGRKEVTENSGKLFWLAQLVHQKMADLLVPKLMPETGIVLSAREKEVLRWTADGKTSYEVSEIMKISERTVNFHVNNAVEKLGTSNKTAASVKAALLNLI